jgi:hypothetical protein
MNGSEVMPSLDHYELRGGENEVLCVKSSHIPKRRKPVPHNTVTSTQKKLNINLNKPPVRTRRIRLQSIVMHVNLKFGVKFLHL